MTENLAVGGAATSVQPGWEHLSACPICGSAESAHFDSVAGEEADVAYRLCRGCGVVYQSPRMTQAALDEYYRSQYAARHQRAETVTEKELRVQSGRARNLIRMLRRRLETVERHLDIGSSAGMLTQAAQQAFGCEAVGIEPSDLYRRFTQGSGRRTYADLSELQAAESEPFDLVTMAHVLEHLPDPVGYLRALKGEWLHPQGRLLVEVPNLFGHTSLERPHLFLFSARTLRRALAEAGFAVVELSVHGAPRSRLIPLYLTALARPAAASPRVSSGPAGVRLRRRLGMAWHRFATRFLTRWAWLPLPELASPDRAGEGGSRP